MNEILRLNQILEYTGMRKNTLAKALGYTNSAIFYQIETGRNGISSNLAIRVSERFPEINQNWILTGKGEMLHDSELNIDEKTKNRIEFLENHLLERLPHLNKSRVTPQHLDKVQPNQNN